MLYFTRQDGPRERRQHVVILIKWQVKICNIVLGSLVQRGCSEPMFTIYVHTVLGGVLLVCKESGQRCVVAVFLCNV